MLDQKKGQNLRTFQEIQLDFAAHIRHPERNPAPSGIEPRRMQIYARIFYNNIESFCASSFKRAKAILGNDQWHELIRSFVHRHVSSTPYFCEIQDEFLEFLVNESDKTCQPPFLQELCHYEWLSLQLLLAAPDISDRLVDKVEMDTELIQSPLLHNLVYQWPVHEIDKDFQPDELPPSPTFLLAFRTHTHNLQFMEVNELTHLILKEFESTIAVTEVIDLLLERMGQEGIKFDRLKVQKQLFGLTEDLVRRDILVRGERN
ncbi:MAG: putative DNA-binding domain-containing protein [Gammaproteobacteria bacterium]|nr:putative DNA-binding domain-containing protein [Gammaproteobacteria bacterium]